MKKLKGILLLAKRTVTDPAGTAAALSSPGSGFSGPLAVYLAACAVYALLLRVKPAGFPSELAEASAEFAGRPYTWLFAAHAVSELALTAAVCALFPAVLALVSAARKAVFGAIAALAACAAYAGAAVYFRGSPLLSLPFLLAVSAAAYRAVRNRMPSVSAFFRFSLAANAAALICMPAFFLAAAVRSEELFILSAFAQAAWTLVLLVKASRTLFRTTAVRAALALLFSALTAVLSLYVLKNAGLLPAEMFRFMMFM